jgi:hypothetical protein
MMRRLLQVARFFVVVPVVPGALLAGFALATVMGMVALALDVGNAGRIVAPVLLLQLFAAASGFRIPARRGHYDLLLTSGVDRSVILLVHWAMSAGPGLLSWFMLILAERVNGGRTLTQPEVVAAALFVPTTAWALTVPLPRMSGAILWLLGLALAATAQLPTDPRAAHLLLWPVALRADDDMLAGCLAVAVAGLIVALAWIRNADFPLEPGQ